MLTVIGYEGTGKGLVLILFIWVALVVVCCFIND